ncbi:MAG: biotin/lipoate A/B protein ligase family protein [Candidatus Thorarchaeota archaeon]
MMDSKWRIVISKETDPEWNIALDEAILRGVIDHGSPNTIRIWQNSKSVIMGRSQDVRAEVNTELCNELGIPIIRRCSGGGTVYMDLGNYNYSINADTRTIIGVNSIPDITRFLCSAIIDLLSQLGCKPRFVPPSSVFIEDWKVSGSAQYYLYEGILHHGTLLIDSDLDMMHRVLNPNSELAHSLGTVPSIPDPVANISLLLGKELHSQEIVKRLVGSITKLLGQNCWGLGSISESENELAQLLVDTKYSDTCWLLGI